MTEKTEVLYNDSCPICSREVRHYEKLSKEAQLDIDYTDIAAPEVLADWGIYKEDAAKRFHVRKDGQIYAGVPAFVVLWSEIPRLRWLARIVNLPVIHWLACKVYDHAAAPLLYWMHKRREARRTA